MKKMIIVEPTFNKIMLAARKLPKPTKNGIVINSVTIDGIRFCCRETLIGVNKNRNIFDYIWFYDNGVNISGSLPC